MGVLHGCSRKKSDWGSERTIERRRSQRWRRSSAKAGRSRGSFCQRGRGKGTGISSMIRPGRGDRRMMRSARTRASSTLWVTKTTVGPDGAAGQLQELALHQLARLGVERGEGLVHQQELGLRRQGARQRDALLHAAAQLARPGVREAREPDPRQHRGDAPGAVGLGEVGEGEGHVAAHRLPRQQAVGLEDHGRGPAGDRGSALDEDGAPVRPQEAGDEAQERGLAAARGADQHHRLAAAGGEVDAVEDRPAPERQRDAGERQAGGIAQRVGTSDAGAGPIFASTCSSGAKSAHAVERRRRDAGEVLALVQPGLRFLELAPGEAAVDAPRPGEGLGEEAQVGLRHVGARLAHRRDPAGGVGGEVARGERDRLDHRLDLVAAFGERALAHDVELGEDRRRPVVGVDADEDLDRGVVVDGGEGADAHGRRVDLAGEERLGAGLRLAEGHELEARGVDAGGLEHLHREQVVDAADAADAEALAGEVADRVEVGAAGDEEGQRLVRGHDAAEVGRPLGRRQEQRLEGDVRHLALAGAQRGHGERGLLHADELDVDPGAVVVALLLGELHDRVRHQRDLGVGHDEAERLGRGRQRGEGRERGGGDEVLQHCLPPYRRFGAPVIPIRASAAAVAPPAAGLRSSSRRSSPAPRRRPGTRPSGSGCRRSRAARRGR